MDLKKKVVTRFCPSPTGYLHIGGIRTALYNYLFAKKNGGDFYVRIEDTDTLRFVSDAELYIRESLEWFGIKPDAAPWVENPNIKGPYRQSERDYTEHLQKLLDSGAAYYAFDTPEYIESAKARYSTKPGSTDFIYNAKYRGEMRNSLTMNANEIREMLNGPYVVRFKNPENVDVIINDLIKGEVKFNTNLMDDKILMKSDRTPTYHLANVCDDHDMGTTHVIRGEEWLPSAAVHQSIYKAFGWEVPEFAHLPLIMNPNGEGKLSKRSAIKAGIPVFPLDCAYGSGKDYVESYGYQNLGYQPDAILNFLILLGWTPKDSKEFMSMEEMISKFEITDVHKSGAKFDLTKLKHFNHHYIANIIPNDRLLSMVNTSDLSYNYDKTNMILDLAKSRSTFPNDLQSIVDIFATGKSTIPKEIPGSTAIKFTTEKSILDKMWGKGLTIHPADWDKETIENLILGSCEELKCQKKEIMPTLRRLIAKGVSGPDVVSIMEILGRNESLHRISLGLLE